MRLVVATKNKGKLREFEAIFENTQWEIVSMGEIGIDEEVIEDADTFEGNALKKATQIMKLCGEVTIADDSGLCVEALGDAPGVYSARYSGEDATDLKNNLKLLSEMEGKGNRRAKFVCVIAIAFLNGHTKTVRGEFHGEIASEMRGSGGFGYDVLFYLPEYKMTSAEIDAQLKNTISHRGKALRLLQKHLRDVKDC